MEATVSEKASGRAGLWKHSFSGIFAKLKKHVGDSKQAEREKPRIQRQKPPLAAWLSTEPSTQDMPDIVNVH